MRSLAMACDERRQGSTAYVKGERMFPVAVWCVVVWCDLNTFTISSRPRAPKSSAHCSYYYSHY